MRNYRETVKTKYTERNDLFPRNDHPDDRTNADFLRDLENKLFIKKVEEKAKRQYNNGKVMNINTGIVYESAADAEHRLNLPRGSVAKKLKGIWKNPRGDKFIYI